jgi:hypothetical protein
MLRSRQTLDCLTTGLQDTKVMGTVHVEMTSYTTSAAPNYWSSLGPVGFAIEFISIAFIVSIVLYAYCRNRSAVFWKRTDYFYFALTILGGATDIVLAGWMRENQSIEISIISGKFALQNAIISIADVCDAISIRSENFQMPTML